MKKHTFFVDKVRLGKKGQITIPKLIRDEDELAENDTLILTHMPGGDIVLRKTRVETPEDKMLKAIENIKLSPADAKSAWEEVLKERRQSDR